MIKVLIVDDSQIARDLMASLLEKEKDISIIGKASDGREAVCFLNASSIKPDVIVLDMKMPLMDGWATMEYVMTHHPTPILIVTELKKKNIASQAKDFGVDEIIHKPVPDEDEKLSQIEHELIKKVRKLSKGNIVI